MHDLKIILALNFIPLTVQNTHSRLPHGTPSTPKISDDGGPTQKILVIHISVDKKFQTNIREEVHAIRYFKLTY